MRHLYAVATSLILGTLLLALNGCQTNQPGTTNTMGTYITNVSANPDKVTNAASAACKDLSLTDINASGTKVDGKVRAYNAQGQEVAIDIEQTGDDVSKVSVRIGVVGDAAMSRQIMDHIKSHLNWL